MNLPVLAGTLSTVLFALGMLPMLVKAARTKDLASYSLGNLMFTNVANAVHSVYVFHLPADPSGAPPGLHPGVCADAGLVAPIPRGRNSSQ